MTDRSRATAGRWRGEALLLGLVLLAAGLLLHVPRGRVPLLYDMLGYAAQGHSLLHGHGNTVALGDDFVPGIYPVGVPALAAAAMALTGPDLRHGLWAVLACALLTLLCVHGCVRRAGGSVWAGVAALLFVLCSPAFRSSSGSLMSQVPTALAVALVALLWISRDSGTALFLAGLLAMLSVLLRYANASFPLALGLAELLFGGCRTRPRSRSLLLLGAGLGLGAAAVLAHNAWCYGDAFATGYRIWGWEVEGQFSLGNVLHAPGAGAFRDRNVLLSAFAGLSELQSIPMVLASLAGLVLCWRDGRERPQARLLAGLCLLAIASTYLLLAGYAFRSESYLVPTVPLTAMLAGYGVARLVGPSRAWLAPAFAAALLGFSLAQPPRIDVAENEARVRFATLEQAGQLLDPDAALITTADPALVEPLFRRQSARAVLYLGPYVSRLVEALAQAELGSSTVGPEQVVAWAAARVADGRPLYLDQNPPPRGLQSLHVAMRTALRERFTLQPTGIANLFRLVPRDGAPPPVTAPAPDPSGR